MPKKRIQQLLLDLWDVIKKTAIRWDEANPWRQSAILAYYSIFSLPALLLIVIVMVGYFFGEDAIYKELSHKMEGLVGSEAAGLVESMVAAAADPGTSRIAFWIGVGFLIFGATTVFYQLQLSLNLVWGVVPRPKQAFLKYLKDRLFSFGLVLAVGFLMMLSFLANTSISLLGDWMLTQWPNLIPPVLRFTHYIMSLTIIAVLFALMFKVLPDAIIRWKSVWVGAYLTALLFALGQYGLSMYFIHADPGSLYGAAGAMILILTWVSYVAMILLFGAEFTRQWAIKFGHGIKAKESARLIDWDNNEIIKSE